MTAKTYHFGIDLPFQTGDSVWITETHPTYAAPRSHDYGKCPLCEEGKIPVAGTEIECPNDYCTKGRMKIEYGTTAPCQAVVLTITLIQDPANRWWAFHEPTVPTGLVCQVGVRVPGGHIRQLWHTKLFLTEEEAQKDCERIHQKTVQDKRERFQYQPLEDGQTS